MSKQFVTASQADPKYDWYFYAIVCSDAAAAEAEMKHIASNKIEPPRTENPHGAISVSIYQQKYVIIGPTKLPSHYFANGGPLYESDTREDVIATLRAGEGLKPGVGPETDVPAKPQKGQRFP
jgi:hypothetical protein